MKDLPIIMLWKNNYINKYTLKGEYILLPNKDLNKGVTNNDNFIGSRAYTFLDSYVYMKNRSYNALYEKNKEILKIENDAIQTNSPKILYNAFIEQMRILDSVIVRIRDFTVRIRDDVEQSIDKLMPSTIELDNFQNSLDKITLMPRFKYVKYKITPIKYTNVIQFYNLYKNEIKEFCEIKDSISNLEKPLLHGRATEYLINTAMTYTNYSDSLLEMEEIKIMSKEKLIKILSFFQKKGELKMIIGQDFKTFQFYLKQYHILSKMTECIKPTITPDNQICINVDGSKYILSFNDYLVLYKHFSAMTKYMLDIINYYNSKFFNKIYAIQSNIELYRSIMRDVVDYANNKDAEIINESVYNDLYGMINGNTQADELLIDDTSDSEEDETLKSDSIDEDVIT